MDHELAEEAEKSAINYIRNTGMKYRLPPYLETPVCNESTLHFEFADFAKIPLPMSCKNLVLLSIKKKSTFQYKKRIEIELRKI